MQDAARVERIKKMEEIFDALLEAVEMGPHAIAQKTGILSELVDYYEGGQWLADYYADERGEIPKDLKRGVLSQDGVYNLLAMISS